MFKSFRTLAFVAVLVIAAAACNSPVAPTPDPGSIGTMVAQTLSAIQFQTAQAFIPITGATSTFTPSPTLSPTVTLTPTPFFTSTPLIPQISVSVPTNCRVGPGKVYDRVGALIVGEITEVYGRDLAGNYWYVRNPDAPGGYCWLWGEYATLAGNIQALPIFTPPPTPTPAPAFTASYYGLESCNGWWVEITLENTGGITYRSILMAISDPATNTTVSLNESRFTNLNGCNASDSRNTLAPAEKLIVSSPAFGYDPTGHKLRGTITLCSDVNVNGTCVTQVIEFKP